MQWRGQDSDVGGHKGVWRTEVPQQGRGAEPLWQFFFGGGGEARRKLTAYYGYLAGALCTILCV